MPTPTVARLQSFLLETVDILANRSLDMWCPSFGPCKARAEARETAAYNGDGGLRWGDGPLGFVWKGGSLLYTAVLEHVRAAATLMEAPRRFWSPAVLARVAVEAAAQARWLLDADVLTGRIRVGRYYTMYLYSSGRLEYTHERTQINTPLHLYGMSQAHMKAEATGLGLVPVLNKKAEVIGFEGQQWPRIDELAAKVIGKTGGYGVLSGASHAEFWSLMSALREGEPSPFGVKPGTIDDEMFKSFELVARACVNALIVPAVEVMRLFNRSTLANDLLRIERMAQPLLGDL